MQVKANEPPDRTWLIILPSAGKSGDDLTTGSKNIPHSVQVNTTTKAVENLKSIKIRKALQKCETPQACFEITTDVKITKTQAVSVRRGLRDPNAENSTKTAL